jgi:phosphoglycolate phosphatase
LRSKRSDVTYRGVKYLLLDLDGTLTDSREGITRCYMHALHAMGRVPPSASELERFIGPPTRVVLRELLGTDDDAEIERGVRIYRERFSSVGLFENALYPGILEALTELRSRGYTLFVCTSKPQVYAVRILEHFRADHYFQHIYGSELDGTRSEKAEVIAYALERENIAPEAAVMIGDRRHDVHGAHANRVRAIGVLYGFGTAEELRQAGADALCASVAQLPEVVAQLAGQAS